MKQPPKPIDTWSLVLGIVQAVLFGGGSGPALPVALVWLSKPAQSKVKPYGKPATTICCKRPGPCRASAPLLPSLINLGDS